MRNDSSDYIVHVILHFSIRLMQSKATNQVCTGVYKDKTVSLRSISIEI